jgi:hypothetical protein
MIFLASMNIRVSKLFLILVSIFITLTLVKIKDISNFDIGEYGYS